MENIMENTENIMEQEVENKGKDTSRYVNPVLGWGSICGALAIVAVIALVVILPLT